MHQLRIWLSLFLLTTVGFIQFVKASENRYERRVRCAGEIVMAVMLACENYGGIHSPESIRSPANEKRGKSLILLINDFE